MPRSEQSCEALSSLKGDEEAEVFDTLEAGWYFVVNKAGTITYDKGKNHYYAMARFNLTTAAYDAWVMGEE